MVNKRSHSTKEAYTERKTLRWSSPTVNTANSSSKPYFQLPHLQILNPSRDGDLVIVLGSLF